MKIPILSGIFTDEDSDFRTAYPKNLTPVGKDIGISKGYLRPASGIIEFGEGPGIDRGGINWNDTYYRVMGSKFVSINNAGVTTEIADVNPGGEVSLDYSFDFLGINSDEKLYLYDGATVQQITDPDLGPVVDFIWIDGYFMSTDGEFLIVTDLNDPFSVNPFKYGSSEIDPDPIRAILKLNNEPYALNRYTIEVFRNIGGSGFPFIPIKGAQINRGTIGTHTCTVFMEHITFIGSGRNESISVWMGRNGESFRIATREIDQILSQCSELELSRIRVEVRVDQGHQQLLIHLPNQTLVYDGVLSQIIKQPVWTTLSSALTGNSQYRAKNLVRVYDGWYAGDSISVKHGKLDDSISSHYGDDVEWSFGTILAYNEGKGMIFHELELIGLSGRSKIGVDSTVWTQYSLDGMTWSIPAPVKTGRIGNRAKRIVWLQQGIMEKFRAQRFRGTSDAHLTISALEVRVEVLND